MSATVTPTHNPDGSIYNGPPHVHHMEPVTAYGAAKLGLWLFLATEILLFAVLFTSFALMRWTHLAEFHAGSHHLNKWLGALNTAVLILSSYTAAMGLDAGQRGNNKGVTRNFLISFICGCIFLCVKAFEYSEKYHHGYFPGGANYFEFKNFLGLYFVMTGLHGLHVVIGMSLMVWVITKSIRGRFGPTYYTPVEMTALYWHLVDLIWIYLFPLLYLVG